MLIRVLAVLVSLSTMLLASGVTPGAATPVRAAQPTGEITVFAAASLTDAFKEIADQFERENPGTSVTFNFGGSNMLRTQLDQGARVDVFASADQTQMDMAAQNGDLSGDPQVFAHNLLTIITPTDNPKGVQGVCDLAQPGLKFVTAQQGVPVGGYTNQMLQMASTPDECGPDFQVTVTGNTVSQESDVRQLVSKVQLGEADAGVSYLTDVTPQIRDQINEVAIPDRLNILATYPIATTNGANGEGAHAFMSYVLSQPGQAMLAKWGFLPAGG